MAILDEALVYSFTHYLRSIFIYVLGVRGRVLVDATMPIPYSAGRRSPHSVQATMIIKRVNKVLNTKGYGSNLDPFMLFSYLHNLSGSD